MHNAIVWSYDLLSEEEQRLLRRLSIFAGGFTLEAAEWVSDEGDTLDVLVSLVDKSLVQQADSHDGKPRYTMLAVIREFALERLARCGEADATYDQLLAWYLARGRLTDRRWGVPADQKDREWFAGWEREINTVRDVLGWAETHSELERGLQLATWLFLFWWAHNHLAEGRNWLERGLAVTPGASRPVWAQALEVLSAIAHRQDDNIGAAQSAREVLSLWGELGDREGSGRAANILAIALYRQGDLEGAERCYREALDHLRAVGDDVVAGEASLGLAQIARDRGDLAGAAALYAETLRWQTAAGVNWGAALCRYGYATVTQALGDVARAVALYRESLRYWRQISDDGSVAICLEGIASALCGVGMAEQAARLLSAAQALRDAIDLLHPCNALASFGGLVSSVRDCLGEAAFTEAWLAGLRLSSDEAIALATTTFPAPTMANRQRQARSSRVQRGLTRREREVLALVTRGLSDREIAHDAVHQPAHGLGARREDFAQARCQVSRGCRGNRRPTGTRVGTTLLHPQPRGKKPGMLRVSLPTAIRCTGAPSDR